jgi:hypothetical protein
MGPRARSLGISLLARTLSVLGAIDSNGTICELGPNSDRW